MKTTFLSKIILIFILLITPALAQQPTADEIIQKVNDLMNQKSVYGKASLTIVTTSGEKRTFVYESWSKDGGEKSLIRYLKPRRVKDQAILMLNNADDIWMYFPRTKRVRKLATHAKKQKMQGSDFTYEDMGAGDAFVTDFRAKRLQDDKMQDHDCYVVELTRKPDSDSHYSRMVVYVIKEYFLPVVIDYYDEDDPILWEKRLVQSDMQTIDGIPTGMTMVMHNQRDNTKTTMKMLEVKYNIPIENVMFTERGLKK